MYRYLRHLLLLLCPCLALTAAAQFPSWDDFVEQLLVEIDEEGAFGSENLIDDYLYLHEHPININQADSTALLHLGFLTARQIEGLHYYIYRHGALHSVGELMLVPELDYRTRQLLSYVVTFGAPAEQQESRSDTWHRMLTRGRSEVSTRMDIPLYMQAGYAPRTQSQLDAIPSRYYIGNAIYHSLRYNYLYGNTLSWGVSAEKDAGEPVLVPSSLKPDYLSGYVQWGDMGALRNIVVGNYRLRLGQGLVMNSDFALGKAMLLQSLGQQSATLKPHRGTGEGSYYTGAAATMGWGRVLLTVFTSWRRLDATLDGEAIATLKDDGYHRTLLEQARRGNTRGNLFGTHLAYSVQGLHLGATVMYQTFNRNFALPKQAYKRYAPQGNAFTNASVDYAWYHHRLSVMGETAIDGKGAVAMLNMLRVRASDGVHLMLLQRHYAHDYWGVEAKSLAASSEVRNEQGVYVGVEWQPHRRAEITAYADMYRFPYLRYRVSEPSCGVDGQVEARYVITDDHKVQVRYRYRMKQRDVAEGYTLLQGTLLNEHTHRLRMRWESVFGAQLSGMLTTQGCVVRGEKVSVGYAATIQGTYSPWATQHIWRISSGATYFNTDYASRIYGYERGALYAYNYHMYAGRGWRGYIMVQYSHKEAPRMSASAKWGMTYYLDRTSIGSGATLIEANHREEVQLQVRYTF